MEENKIVPKKPPPEWNPQQAKLLKEWAEIAHVMAMCYQMLMEEDEKNAK